MLINRTERAMESGRVLFGALAVLLALVPSAFAGELRHPRTLDQCVRIALSDNPDQRIAESGIKAAAVRALFQLRISGARFLRAPG